MRYPNLEAEMARKQVTQGDIAAVIDKDVATISRRMTGAVGSFSVNEALEIRKELFPTESIEYLFAKEAS